MSDRSAFPLRGPWPAGAGRPVATPIYPSVVYGAETPDTLDAQYEGRAAGYTYSREGHPNASHLAAMVDALEGAEGGQVLSSGMAAVTVALLAACQAGDHVIGGNQLYGRSLRMLREELPRLGIATDLVDPTDAGAVAAALRPETRLVLLEVVSNPTLRIADIEGIAALCRDRGVLLAIDNTFTTPRGFRPFEAGADIIIHSLTKLLSGHSDAMLGYAVARAPELNARMETLAVTLGFTASPFDCWLAERGLYSFDLRYERAAQNAEALAEALAALPNVRRVLYPTRPDHPDHNRAQALLRGRGGNMVSFEIDGDRQATNALVTALEGVPFAPTLGDIGTTLSHPATSSHRALTAQARADLGMGEGFFRVSVGIEPVEALTGAFARAIAAAASAG